MSLNDTQSKLALAVLACLAVAVPAHAFQAGTRSGASVNGVEQAHRIDCGGQPAEVSGSGNRIDFVGNCPGLTVNGVDNQISIILPAGAPLRVSGVDNVVTWRTSGQGKPRISVQGVDNQVRPSR